MEKFVLASGSPRRKHLLELAEIDFDIVVPQTDESYPPHLSPEQIAVYIAAQKAAAAVALVKPDQIIIAADTIVVLNGEIIGKPKDRADGIAMLSKLSGATHQVITGVVLQRGDKKQHFSETTIVEFHPLSQRQIEFYIDNYQPTDKAGAYAIQEWIGVVGIKCINGDFYNVMGLPVSKVLQALLQF